MTSTCPCSRTEYSGKRRKRRMAETAAHLVDHVIPPRPLRQWVLSVPKRRRWYLKREPKAVSAVLHILLRTARDIRQPRRFGC